MLKMQMMQTGRFIADNSMQTDIETPMHFKQFGSKQSMQVID